VGVLALEALQPANEREILGYLSRAPYDNVFVHWLIQSRAVVRTGGEVVAARSAAGSIEGVCYFGPQVVPCAQDDAALEAFAEYACDAPQPNMIVGPKAAVDGFWQRARTRWRSPRVTRSSQPVYALDRAHLGGSRRDAAVERAGPDELDEIAENSRQMFLTEIGISPGRAPSDYRERTRRILEAGWWWRCRSGGRLVFQCNVGSQTPYTAQIQGVWTPPAERGQGHATRAMGAICDHLLDENATLCLFVNAFNTSAIALYERLGFFRAGEFASVLF